MRVRCIKCKEMLRKYGHGCVWHKAMPGIVTATGRTSKRKLEKNR